MQIKLKVNMKTKLLSLLLFLFLVVTIKAQNVGVGTTNPQSKLSVGASSQFQVDSIGNIKKINNVPYSFPTTQGTTGQALVNSGSGLLKWSSTPNGAVPMNGVIMAEGYDTSIINEGYSPYKIVSLSGNSIDSFSWKWGSLTPISTTNAPSARYSHSAVWTGTEMIIWGGTNNGTTCYNDGYRYNPKTNVWIPISNLNAPTARYGHSAVWTGSVMIIWGGTDGTKNLSTGQMYDPATDTWGNATAISNVPTARSYHSAVWDGTNMIVWGGAADGKKYNPVTNTWGGVVSTVNAPSARSYHSAVWDGNNMIIWGGSTSNTQWEYSGAIYNSSTDTWTSSTQLTNINAAGRYLHSAVWDGSKMIICGGAINPNMNTFICMSYNNSNGWQIFPNSSQVFEHTAIWTGSEIIIWGGNYIVGSPLNTGQRFGYYPNLGTTGNNTLWLYKKN